MARELDLTNNQYRMLLHQCDALAQAGARGLWQPRRLAAGRAGNLPLLPQPVFLRRADALLMLNVDFTPANDWNQQLLYLTYDEVNALDFSAPKDRCTPGLHPAGKSRKRRPGRLDLHARGLVYYCRMAPVWSATRSTFITATPA